MNAQPVVESYLSDASMRARFMDEVSHGLTNRPRHLHPKWFYDDRGCELFDQITHLPEYYLTRAESRILAERAGAIEELTRPDILVELGSGESEKTLILLDAIQPRQFVALDVSEGALNRSLTQLNQRFPHMQVHGIVADFEQHLMKIPRAGRRLIAFLGSTIGNLEPAARAAFLQNVSEMLTPGDTLLLGVDLVKDVSRLEAAYDDAAGVTSEFNKNVLSVLNNELGANFDLDAFEHVARWDARHEWMEMAVRATGEQHVTVQALNLTIHFTAGETMRTEISAKFRRETLTRELERADLNVTQWWTDAEGDFAVLLAMTSQSQ